MQIFTTKSRVVFRRWKTKADKHNVTMTAQNFNTFNAKRSAPPQTSPKELHYMFFLSVLAVGYFCNFTN